MTMARSYRSRAPLLPPPRSCVIGLSLILQRIAPGEGFRSAQVEGDVLGRALRPVPAAAESAGDHVALGLADGEEPGHDLRPRRVIDAAGVVCRHHEFAERAA